MATQATSTERWAGLRSGWSLGMVIGLWIGMASSAAWSTVRFGDDIEVQAWYRMRHTFQTDGKEHFEWVQWRNEVFAWVIWRNVVKNGQLFDRVPIPGVHSAEINARYQLRLDPVYYLRKH